MSYFFNILRNNHVILEETVHTLDQISGMTDNIKKQVTSTGMAKLVPLKVTAKAMRVVAKILTINICRSLEINKVITIP
jgi:hypothetical protein